MPLRHAKVSSKPDGSDNTLVQPSDWNADHHIPGQTNGDLIVRSGGEWTRLAVGTNGQVMRVSSGAPAWQDAAGIGFPSNPQNGDLVYYNGTSWVRLAIGTANQLLTVSGGAPSWQNAPTELPTNPQAGDLVFYDGTNWARLAVGSPNGVGLMVVSGSPAWARDPWGIFVECPWLPSPSTNWRSLDIYTGTGGTLGLTAGRCYFIPFVVRFPRALTALGIDVSTSSAGTAEVAVYESSTSTWRPTNRLAYVSGLDTGSTGVKSGSVSVTLQPGLYWAALRATAAATVRGVAGAIGWNVQTGGNNRATHLFNTDSSLANPVASDPTSLGTGTIPHVLARW